MNWGPEPDVSPSPWNENEKKENFRGGAGLVEYCVFQLVNQCFLLCIVVRLSVVSNRPFSKVTHVTWIRELRDKHQNKSYVSEDRFEGNLDVFAQWWTFVQCLAAQIVPTERRTKDIIVFPQSRRDRSPKRNERRNARRFLRASGNQCFYGTLRYFFANWFIVIVLLVYNNTLTHVVTAEGRLTRSSLICQQSVRFWLSQ